MIGIDSYYFSDFIFGVFGSFSVFVFGCVVYEFLFIGICLFMVIVNLLEMLGIGFVLIDF